MTDWVRAPEPAIADEIGEHDISTQYGKAVSAFGKCKAVTRG